MAKVGDGVHVDTNPIKDMYIFILSFGNETIVKKFEESELIKALEETEQYEGIDFLTDYPVGRFGVNEGLIIHMNTYSVIYPIFKRELTVELKFKDEEIDS